MPSRRPAGRRERPAPKAESNKDNVLAIKVGIGAAFLVAFILLLVTLSDDDKPVTPDRRDRPDTADFRDTTGPDRRVDRPTEESTVPDWLGRQLLVAVGNEDEALMDELIDWPLLFDRLGRENAWEESRRWESLDAEGKENLKTKYILQILDPDVIAVLRKYALPQILTNELTSSSSIGPQAGTVGFTLVNERDQPLTAWTITSQLLPGFDPVADAEDKKAWRIVRIETNVMRTLDNKLSRAGKTDIGKDIGKPEKKKVDFGPKGPPEADVAEVEWVAGTAAALRQTIEELARKAVSTADVRAADLARAELIATGKAAIPGILNAIAGFDHDTDEGMKNTWVLVQALREITGVEFNYAPGNTTQGLGLGGMTRSTPEERAKSLRQWYGWWKETGSQPSWEPPKKAAPEEESWDDFED